jgi:predicted O-linked N-acetylglucosamine transferase (SPINDLY family)
MRILDEVPDGVLWLPQSGEAVESNLRRAAEQRGIRAERLIFAARAADKAQHLERLMLADIALDTLSYNGHTTTCDALWAGIPVVTSAGRHFASRVGASLLKAAGLAELIAADVEDYVALAVHLARTPGERARLRAQLGAARERAPLFDTGKTVADLERAYERIWADFLSGAPAADIEL